MNARRLALTIPAVLFVLVGVLAWASAPVLAAAPEEPGPVTLVAPVGATNASVEGILSPQAEGHPGTYEFLYNASKTECKGGSRAPQSPGMALGFEHEEVSQALTSLSPRTEYTVCLLERNTKGEETVGPGTTFTTARALEVPTTGSASGATASSAILHGVLDPGGPGEGGSYEFLYRASSAECQGGRTSGSAVLAKEQEKEAVQSEITGLLPNTEYSFCLLARNEAGETKTGPAMIFTTLSEKPNVTDESRPSLLGPTSATVTAQIDTGGLEAEYRVQYGTSKAYGSEITTTTLAPGVRGVTVELTGLEPSTEYHSRFVVKTTLGEVFGADVAFSTYPTGLSALPDKRAFEMVTPPENHNAEVYGPLASPSSIRYTALPVQASEDGNAVEYLSEPTTGGNGLTGLGFGNAQLARRSPEGGWTQTPIQPSARTVSVFQGFSDDLSADVIEACQQPVLAPDAPSLPAEISYSEPGYNLLYTRNNSQGTYQPFFTSTPPNRPGGAERNPLLFGATGVEELASEGIDEECAEPLVYAGASQDFSKLLFESNDALLEGSGSLATELNNDVKHEVAEQRPEQVLHEEAEKLRSEQTRFEIEGNAQGEKEKFELRIGIEEKIHALFNSGIGDHNNLYVSSAGKPVLVNVLPNGTAAPNATFGAQGTEGYKESHPVHTPDFSQVISADGSRIFWTDLNSGIIYVRENGSRTAAVSSGPAQYWTASSDGRYVFYTEAGKLQRFDLETQAREELTVGTAAMQGVLGSSETGDRLYFVADGSLAAGASAGEPNLYMWHSGAITFIATLGEGDSLDWTAPMGHRTSDVAPDGNGLVFTSSQSLTGYANEGQKEVYVYEAESGDLFCTSCSQTGEHGSSGSIYPSYSNVYSQRWISNDGSRVFFDSGSQLVPQDTDTEAGGSQVYEWERPGADGCQRTQGCTYLLSGGFDQAMFLDASATGDDVFIVSTARLLPQDEDDYPVVYDARVDGTPITKTACTGTGCQGVPSAPPPFATPASVTFEGVGNFPAPSTNTIKPRRKQLTKAQHLAKALKACKSKKRRRPRALCEMQVRKRYGTKSTVKNSTARKGSNNA